MLAAGNRRATTANTIVRDGSWDSKGLASSLYLNPDDALDLGLANGDTARITTATGSATTFVEINDIQRKGTVALPNGLGIDYRRESGETVQIGIPPNELTASSSRDFFAGTPWHKYVPAQIEKV